jgi:hypothetical protein
MSDINGYRLLFAEISSFKGIKHIVLELDGRSAYFIAGNAQGKTSMIDALLSPLDSTFVPTEPINKDSEEKHGVIHLTLGNGEKKYDVYASYTPSNRTGTVKLFCDGVEVKTKVKTKILELFGDLSFDVYQFMKMSMADKIKEVIKLTGKEKELREVEQQLNDLKETRKLQDHDIKTMQTVNDKDNRPFEPEEIRKYEKPEPVDAITKEIAELQPAIDNWNRVNDGMTNSKQIVARWNTEEKVRAENEYDELQTEIKAMEIALQKLRDKSAKLSVDHNIRGGEIEAEELKIKKGEAWLEKNQKPNLEVLNTRLTNAGEHNRMHEIINKYRERQNQLIAKQAEREKTQKEIEAVQKNKIAIIASSQLPVDGFDWDEKMLYYNGLPFEQNQLNTATYTDVGIELAMAMNKKLRLVMIREASLLDKPTMARVIEKIHSRGYNFIAEIVDPEGGPIEVKYVEREIEA